MDFQQQLNQQRVKHIVSSYHLDRDEAEPFAAYLEELLQAYPSPLVELAITETVVDGWAAVPMVRGLGFLNRTHDKLKNWETQPIISTVTPEQFYHVTGLDPTPVFGSAEFPPPRSIVQPS